MMDIIRLLEIIVWPLTVCFGIALAANRVEVTTSVAKKMERK